MGVRRVIGLMLVLALCITGCSSTSNEKPVPPGPEREVSFLWQADNPTDLSPTGYGKLRPLELIKPTLQRSGRTEAIGGLSLAATFPAVPAELPVYEAGNYPLSYQERFSSEPPWLFAPTISIVQYDARRGQPLAVGKGSPAEVAERVLQANGLLMPDSLTPTVRRLAIGVNRVQFYRHLNDIVVYGDKPACVDIDPAGQVTFLQIRRRPLVSKSVYPLRSPEEAWQSLQAGEWYQVSKSACQDEGTDLPAKIEQFQVTQVELAYWEPHSDREVQVMIPYYLFRNDEGHTLYVPAVKPEWMDQEWIDSNQL